MRHEDAIPDELELDPPSLDVQVVEHLGGSGPAGDVMHDRGEDHHLLAVGGGAEEEHRRSDSDGYVTLGVADRKMAVHLGKLGVDQDR